MSANGLLEAFLFLVCLGGTMVFSACETALTSVSLSAWDRLRQTHLGVASAYHLWSRDPGLVLATLLFCNTLCSLAAGLLANAFLLPAVAALRLPFGIAALLSSFVAGAVILVWGEIWPKLYARRYQERVLVVSVHPVLFVTRLLGPVMKGLSAAAQAIVRLISRRPAEPLVTAEELRQVLSESEPESLAPPARRILSNLMAFDRVRVEEVMVPRAHMAAVQLEQNTDRMFRRMIRSGFSRFPVYFGNLDNIVGVVYAKDLLVEWRSSGLLVLEDLLRPPYRIAPDAPLSTLLQAFRQGQHMAIVTDAAGNTRGLITIEDVVETIVGDIADEFDQPLFL